MYILNMEFIETPIFTKKITELLSLESYKDLQFELLKNPDKDSVIVGGGGIRKLRWNLENQGKSGSIWIIYYYKVIDSKIFMIYAYKKTEKITLTEQETKVFKELAKEFNYE